MSKRLQLLILIFALVGTSAAPAFAQTPPQWVQVGTLSCEVDPNIGFIIIGYQPMECLFTPASMAAYQEPPQTYDGAISTAGLNIGISAGSVLGWVVFAPSTGVPAGALAGDYLGVSGNIGLGVGVGANVLLGGSNSSFALQPISLQGSIALNIILGASSLKLRWH
jgi:hypothetical protein